MKRLLMPCDEPDFPYVGADADTVWCKNTCQEACTSCGAHQEKMYINLEKDEWLCEACVVVVTMTELVAAWKELHGERLANELDSPCERR